MTIPAGGVLTGRTQADPSGNGEVISEVTMPDGQTTWVVSTPATRMTPYGPITPITPFDQYALQNLLPMPVATAAQANQVKRDTVALEAARLTPDPSAAVIDPAWLRSDCNCRGGRFVEVPGQPQNSYCLPPDAPTGRMFDINTRGCIPIPGFRQPILPMSAKCYWKGYNICLYGGIALGVIFFAWALSKKRAGSASAEPKKAETELGAGI